MACSFVEGSDVVAQQQMSTPWLYFVNKFQRNVNMTFVGQLVFYDGFLLIFGQFMDLLDSCQMLPTVRVDSMQELRGSSFPT